MLRLTSIFCSLCILFSVSACDTKPHTQNEKQPFAPEDSLVEVDEPVYDYVFGPEHADKLKTKKWLAPPLKADQYDDARWKAPQNYAITIPPAAQDTLRPMVEWEPMKSLVLQWPGGYLTSSKNASSTMLKIAKNAATVAEVWIITNPEAPAVIEAGLKEIGMTAEQIAAKVKFVPTQIDSIWFIDSGPLPIVDTASNTYAFADFRYYHERSLDDGIPTVLARALPSIGHGAAETYRMPLNTEGGTFQATSDGICFTGTRQLYYMSCATTGCDPSTGGKPDWHAGGYAYASMEDVNKHPLADEVRAVWKKYAGCKDVIVTNSVTDDGTGHIDMYLKVLDDQRVMLGQYEPPFVADTRQEENAQLLDETAAYLEAYEKPDGTKFKVERLVMPGHRNTNDGMMPFTYINSTFINGLNLWPATEYPEWEESRSKAEAQWKAAMPGMEHIWIDSTELSFWSGAIHCITRTVPDLPEGSWVGDGVCEGQTCSAAANAYSGECQPNNVKEDICWGPEWECTCNDCDSGCAYQPAPYEGDCSDGKDDDGDGDIDCADIDCSLDPSCSACPEWMTYEGCCEEDVLKYCDSGKRKAAACEYGCGWSESGFYDCAGGDTNAITGAADPSGENPIDCSAFTCETSCDGKTCGDDGCGGTCGTCGDFEECTEGACVSKCNNLCETAGDTGCNDTGMWTCTADSNGCLVPVVTEECVKCTEGGCVEEVIEPPNSGDGDGSNIVKHDDGCSAGTGSDSLPLTLLSLGVLAVIAMRRRRETVA
jgi:MYXO-CTERM domain-containing protein